MKHALLLTAILAAGLLAGCAQPGVVGSRSASVERAVEAVFPALVRINVVSTAPAGGRMVKSQGSGSGVVISADGYVVTNHHVAGDADRIVCRMSDGREIPAVRVGTDPMTDICVLKLQPAEKELTFAFARWGDSDTLRVGDNVLAMGSPSGVSQSVTMGVVSNTALIVPYGTGLQLRGEAVGMLVRWIGHDAAISPGNSGGPLVNLRGEIVGINEVGLAGLGGAIPSNLARVVVEQLIESGKVARAFTGLECQARLKNDPRTEGVLLGGVVPDSPAASAGLRPGDLMLAVDGIAVSAATKEDLPIVYQLLLSQPAGKALTITFLRDGKREIVDVVTTARQAVLGDDEEIKSWGMTALDMTGPLAIELQRPDAQGVIVRSVRPSGPCAVAKPALGSGLDIITEVAGRKVSNIAELRRITDELTKPDEETPVLVSFDRGRQQLLTVVKLGKKPPPRDVITARKAWLGVETQVLTRDLAEALGMARNSTGVRVTQVKSDTAAARAGLRVGDVILKVDKNDVRDSKVEDNTFTYMIQAYAIDSVATLTLWRSGEKTTLDVTLEISPMPQSELRVYEDRQFEFSARDLATADRDEKQLEKEVRGVLVTAVENGGWAALGGLAVGDVVLAIDGGPVGDLETLEKTLTQAAENKAPQLVLFIRRGVHTMFLQLEPMWEK